MTILDLGFFTLVKFVTILDLGFVRSSQIRDDFELFIFLVGSKSV
jgi:hypothetical protein